MWRLIMHQNGRLARTAAHLEPHVSLESMREGQLIKETGSRGCRSTQHNLVMPTIGELRLGAHLEGRLLLLDTLRQNGPRTHRVSLGARCSGQEWSTRFSCGTRAQATSCSIAHQPIKYLSPRQLAHCTSSQIAQKPLFECRRGPPPDAHAKSFELCKAAATASQCAAQRSCTPKS